ncbi:MAG: 2-amino-4-hydroxy-6-hydroxymethyldihydropteridine diphosphokinase [Bacteroidota bacterium]
MSQVFLGFGSNKGDRFGYLRLAVDSVNSIPGVAIKAVSSVYETEPRGVEGQSDFLNAAVLAESALSAEELAVSLKSLELSLGRTASERWGPREIDIDLLLFDGLVLDSARLVIPHPEMHKRRFVLEPLRELAPDFVHPRLKTSIADLYRQCPDKGWVKKTSMKLTRSE